MHPSSPWLLICTLAGCAGAPVPVAPAAPVVVDVEPSRAEATRAEVMTPAPGPSSPEVEEEEEEPPEAVQGSMWGDRIGESFGAGGLGLAGLGAGAGGVGLGSAGTSGLGGIRYGVAVGSRIRMGPIDAEPGLPPEVISRLVRSELRQFRTCYAAGLKRDPTLKGQLIVRFTIDRHGDVIEALEAKGSSLSDSAVVSCLLRTFEKVVFPQPVGGHEKVSVSSSLELEPPPPRKSGASPAP